MAGGSQRSISKPPPRHAVPKCVPTMRANAGCREPALRESSRIKLPHLREQLKCRQAGRGKRYHASRSKHRVASRSRVTWQPPRNSDVLPPVQLVQGKSQKKTLKDPNTNPMRSQNDRCKTTIVWQANPWSPSTNRPSLTNRIPLVGFDHSRQLRLGLPR